MASRRRSVQTAARGPLSELATAFVKDSFRGIPFSATLGARPDRTVAFRSGVSLMASSMSDRLLRSFNAGQRIRQQNLRLHVSRCRGKSLVRPDFGIVESSGKQEMRPALTCLDVGTIDEHIRGADELHRRLRCLFRPAHRRP